MINKDIKILLIEDNPGDARLIEEYLKEIIDHTFSIDVYKLFEPAFEALINNTQSKSWDIILLDLTLPDRMGLGMIEEIQSVNPYMPVVVFTGLNDHHTALEALNYGAQDYLIKDEINSQILLKSILYSLERKKNRDEVDFQKTLLAYQFEASQDGILVLNVNGKIHSYNQKLLSLFFKNKDEQDDFIKSEKTFDSFLKVFKNHHQKLNQSFLDEIKLKKAGEKEIIKGELNLEGDFFIEYYCSNIIGPYGKQYGEAWYFRDITERKKIEKLKDEFLSAVSHELRTPLAIIKGSVDNLKDGIVGELTEKQNKVIQTTSRNIQRLTRLINDLLDLSRLESGKVNFQPILIDMVSFLREHFENFSQDALSTKFDFSFYIEKDKIEVMVDPDMIFQVFTNFFSNSLRYAESNIKVSINLINSKDLVIQKDNKVFLSFLPYDYSGKLVVMAIHDDGIGLEKENLSKVFNKFEQINRPQGGAGYKGTGLGLAICKEIAQYHQGIIGVESIPNNNTQFFLGLRL